MNKLFTLANSIFIGEGKPEGKKTTYRKGDVVINIGDNRNNEPMYICVKGGVPGEWIVVGGDNYSMEAGMNGKSAYEIAVDFGFKGNEEEWLKTLKGEPGQQGPVGPKGDKGNDGKQGPVGPKGNDCNAKMEFNKDGELVVTINGVTKVFVPKN